MAKTGEPRGVELNALNAHLPSRTRNWSSNKKNKGEGWDREANKDDKKRKKEKKRSQHHRVVWESHDKTLSSFLESLI